MTLQDLKTLSQKRTINMKQLYLEAGLSVSSMNSRLSTMSGSLSLEEQKAIELALLNQIKQVSEILSIDPLKIANALKVETKEDQHSVMPVAYIELPECTTPIYLPEDLPTRRSRKSGTKNEMFWGKEKLMEAFVKNSKVSQTERGKEMFSE